MTDARPLSVIIDGHQRAVEAARLALRTAGPASGLHGAAAACVDQQLGDAAAWIGRVAEKQREREEHSSLNKNWQPLGDVASAVVDRLSKGKTQ